jgi:D-tagatose-1,6-bisphosphate aldolase subunit GatZ/KbaZ
MSCADDPVPLAPKVVAQRAARLCQAAEEVASDEQKAALTYVIGTEVPVPGGEASSIDSVHVTRVEDAAQTLKRTVCIWCSGAGRGDEARYRYRRATGRGVRSHPNYSLSTAGRKALSGGSARHQWSTKLTPPTTRPARLIALVRDHFAILKVGPALTFALREAIFALAQMENELVARKTQPRAGGDRRSDAERAGLLEKVLSPDMEPGDGGYPFQPV